MNIDVKRNGIYLVLFIVGLVLIWCGMTGRFGLLLGAIFVPEYMSSVEGISNG